jgi:hypothetical protein
MRAPAFAGLRSPSEVYRGVICRICGRRGRYLNPFESQFERRMRR